MVDCYETICNNHNQVLFNLRQIKKLVKSPEAIQIINETMEIVRYCKKQGQRMENRLRKWNDFITNVMGYERVRRK